MNSNDFSHGAPDASQQEDDSPPCSASAMLLSGEGNEFVPLAQARTRSFNIQSIPVTGIEAMVCADIARRQQMGIKKYGTTLAENPAEHVERLQHAYEEALDLANYLKWAIEQIKKGAAL